MAFDPADQRITAYLLDELSGEECAQFEAELQESAELRDFVESMRGMVETLHADLTEEQPVSLTEDQRSAVRTEMSRPAARQSSVKPTESGHGLWIGAAAGGLALTLGAMLWLEWANRPAPVGVIELAEKSLVEERLSGRPIEEMLMDDETMASGAGPDIAGEGFAGNEVSRQRSSVMMGVEVEAEVIDGPSAWDALGGADMMGVDVEVEVDDESTGFEALGAAPDSSRSVMKSGAGGMAGGGGDGLTNLRSSGSARNARSVQPLHQFGMKPASSAAPVSGGALSSGLDRSSNAPASELSVGTTWRYKKKIKRMTAPQFLRAEANEFAEAELARPAAHPLPGEAAPVIDADQGRGPGEGGDKHDRIVENEFLRVSDAPLSTFSIDVDTASYSKVRMYLQAQQQLPRPDAVRIEELINYFPYGYQPPQDEVPFAAHQVAVRCPWNPEHYLVRVAIKGRDIDRRERPASNLVFLLDVSGSMDRPNKLPLLKEGMKMLTRELGENDKVAIVVYAGAAGMVLDSTPGTSKEKILDALERLKAGGSTNGGQGIQLAYQAALDNFIPGGVNRVILCTDGDFNVGTTGTDELVRTVEEHAKSGVFLSAIGFGMGNHNDAMMEQISNRGNGNYGFVDSGREARKVLVEQMSATLVTIAKDVKIQVEFNPSKVAAYRLIGYENRVLAAQDFNDDTKDAGEIGAGHTVTALYELVPAGTDVETAPAVDDLKYQSSVQLTEAAEADEILTLKIRYKQPEGEKSQLLTFPLGGAVLSLPESDRDFQFAAAVASFGMLLRQSSYAGNSTYASVLEIATPAVQADAGGYRAEFLDLVRKAAQYAGQPMR